MSDSSGRTRWSLRVARRLCPGRVWSGAGVVVRKVLKDSIDVQDAYVTTFVVPVLSSSRVDGWVPSRWLLVVQDSSGQEHYVNVHPQVWIDHEEGDVITAAHPLVEVR